MKLLADAGFEVGITRQQDPDERGEAVAQRFRQLLRKQVLAEDLPIVALPELGRPNAAPSSPALHVLASPLAPTACSRSRMLLRREGELRYSPCPLVDDDPARDLGGSLQTACAAMIEPSHARCRICLTQGVDYIGPTRQDPNGASC